MKGYQYTSTNNKHNTMISLFPSTVLSSENGLTGSQSIVITAQAVDWQVNNDIFAPVTPTPQINNGLI